MKYIILVLFVCLTSCLKEEKYTVDQIYSMKERCSKIAEYMKQPFEFHKENEDYLCFIKRGEGQVVFFPSELGAVNRFILIMKDK